TPGAAPKPGSLPRVPVAAEVAGSADSACWDAGVNRGTDLGDVTPGAVRVGVLGEAGTGPGCAGARWLGSGAGTSPPGQLRRTPGRCGVAIGAAALLPGCERCVAGCVPGACAWTAVAGAPSWAAVPGSCVRATAADGMTSALVGSDRPRACGVRPDTDSANAS